MDFYPNPTSTNFYIKSKIKIKGIRIYNVLGKLVKSINKDKQNIDISAFSKGSYFVKVFTEQGTINKIIRKQ